MALPLAFDFKRFEELRVAIGVNEARRKVKLETIRAELDKRKPDVAAALLTLMEMLDV